MANNVNRDKCLNITCKYGIEYNESNIEEIEKKDYCLFKNLWFDW